eukprot:Skav211621  [mRNA]  locus=scaffold3083:435898:437287:- [translate_table: standard]
MPRKVGHVTVGLFGAVGVLTGLALLSVAPWKNGGEPGLALGSSNLAGLVALNATVPPKRRATFVGLASCGLATKKRGRGIDHGLMRDLIGKFLGFYREGD